MNKKNIFFLVVGILAVFWFLKNWWPEKQSSTQIYDHSSDYDVKNIKDISLVQPVVIIGGGIAGFSAATHAYNNGYSPLVIDKARDEGYLAFCRDLATCNVFDICDENLSQVIREQFELTGIKVKKTTVADVDFSTWPFKITCMSGPTGDKETILAASCILATGTSPHRLGVVGEREYLGRGVFFPYTFNQKWTKGGTAVVVGGGDTAMTEASFLATDSKQVYVLVRSEADLIAKQKNIDRVRKLPNVKMIFDVIVESVLGDGQVMKKIVVKKLKDGTTKELLADGLFLAIGAKPNSKLFQGKLELDERGYIKTFDDQEASVKGVFAVGDLADKKYGQVIVAAGDGCKAATQAVSLLRGLGLTYHSFEVQKNCSIEKNSEQLVKDCCSEHVEGKLYKRNPELPIPIKDVESKATFIQTLKIISKPVLVSFYATWSMPSGFMKKILEEIAQETELDVAFYQVDIERFPDIAKKYCVESVPAILLINDQGSIVQRIVGSIDKQNLLKLLDNL